MATKLIKQHINVTAIRPWRVQADMNRVRARSQRRSGARVPCGACRTDEDMAGIAIYFWRRVPAIQWSAPPSAVDDRVVSAMPGWRLRMTARDAPRRIVSSEIASSEWPFVLLRYFTIRTHYSRLRLRLDLHIFEAPGCCRCRPWGRDPAWQNPHIGHRRHQEAMKSPSSVDGSQSPLRLFPGGVVDQIRPSGRAWISLNSPIARWNATLGRVSLKSVARRRR